MSREIKFRYWNGKFMVENVGYHPTMARNLAVDPDEEGYEIGGPGSLIISPFMGGNLMQFTGLKDKNGVDIYEGDIIQDIVVGMKSEIVYTEYANFGMKPVATTAFPELVYEVIDPAWTETTAEVIGNIYQNLLK